MQKETGSTVDSQTYLVLLAKHTKIVSLLAYTMEAKFEILRNFLEANFHRI